MVRNIIGPGELDGRGVRMKYGPYPRKCVRMLCMSENLVENKEISRADDGGWWWWAVNASKEEEGGNDCDNVIMSTFCA